MQLHLKSDEDRMICGTIQAYFILFFPVLFDFCEFFFFLNI